MEPGILLTFLLTMAQRVAVGSRQILPRQLILVNMISFTAQRHAEKLIERILFLEGIPSVGNLNKILIGKNIEEQFRNDHEAGTEAISVYKDAIRLAVESFDDGTAQLLRSILADEENHLDWLEIQLAQIGQVELQNYLLEQIA